MGYFHLFSFCKCTGLKQGDVASVWLWPIVTESLDILFKCREQALDVRCIYTRWQNIRALCIQQELFELCFSISLRYLCLLVGEWCIGYSCQIANESGEKHALIVLELSRREIAINKSQESHALTLCL